MNRMLQCSIVLTALAMLASNYSVGTAAAAVIATQPFIPGGAPTLPAPGGNFHGARELDQTGWETTTAWQVQGLAAVYATNATGLSYSSVLYDYAFNETTTGVDDTKSIQLTPNNSSSYAIRTLNQIGLGGSNFFGNASASTYPTLYTAFLINYGSFATGSTASAGLHTWFGTYGGTGSGNGFGNGIRVGNYGGTDNDEWGLNVFGTITGSSLAIDPGVTNLVVLKVDFNAAGNETVSVFVNPDLALGEPGTPDITYSFEFGATEVTHASLRSQGPAGTVALVDGLAITTQWSDLAVEAVPEPGTYALLGCAAIGLGAWYRRRKLSQA